MKALKKTTVIIIAIGVAVLFHAFQAQAQMSYETQVPQPDIELAVVNASDNETWIHAKPKGPSVYVNEQGVEEEFTYYFYEISAYGPVKQAEDWNRPGYALPTSVLAGSEKMIPFEEFCKTRDGNYFYAEGMYRIVARLHFTVTSPTPLRDFEIEQLSSQPDSIENSANRNYTFTVYYNPDSNQNQLLEKSIPVLIKDRDAQIGAILEAISDVNGNVASLTELVRDALEDTSSDTETKYHVSDTNKDYKVSQQEYIDCYFSMARGERTWTEAKRAYRFYHAGGYHVQAGTEDGFAPGLA